MTDPVTPPEPRSLETIPPAGTEYDPRMGVPHVIHGAVHPGHPGETCEARTPAAEAGPSLEVTIHAISRCARARIEVAMEAELLSWERKYGIEFLGTELMHAETLTELATEAVAKVTPAEVASYLVDILREPRS